MTPSEYARVTDTGIFGFFGDYRFLSNFEPSTIVIGMGECYATVAHAYQAQKAIDYKDKVRFMLGNEMTAAKAQKEGQLIAKRSDWDKVKYHIMLGCVFAKFHQNKELANKLIATGGKYLEELNHWGDVTWGVDYRGDVGKNWLGMILMDVRKCLKSEAATQQPNVYQEALNILNSMPQDEDGPS